MSQEIHHFVIQFASGNPVTKRFYVWNLISEAYKSETKIKKNVFVTNSLSLSTYYISILGTKTYLWCYISPVFSFYIDVYFSFFYCFITGNSQLQTLNSANPANLINHWSTNWGQFIDPVSHLCLTSTAVASWSLTQEMALSNPFTVMIKTCWGWIQWKHLGKTFFSQCNKELLSDF